MLIDKTNGHLDKVKEFAARVGKLEQLQDRLDYLDGYASGRKSEGIETRCTLFPDWAPQSFAFLLEARRNGGAWERWFNGGLIFHGTHDNGGDGGPPTYSVCLNPTDGWSIHT